MTSQHTILLAQFSDKPQSRQYSDFETLAQALDGICQLFEQQLKMQQPNTANISYDISDLFAFVNALPDLSVLLYDSAVLCYQPKGRAWIKDQILVHLKQQAGLPQEAAAR